MDNKRKEMIKVLIKNGFINNEIMELSKSNLSIKKISAIRTWIVGKRKLINNN